ncbi:MAG: ADP-ribosylglycohydrolase family protein [bacterium]
MNPMQDYEERVYAGVLGKVAGVYAGRPIEGATSAALLARLGEIGHYVHEEVGKPLVVADDDISGTLTFIRALEDSGLYADTPPDFYGKTWLNYLIPGRTVLWWGNFGHSTEHTAYLRLATGHPSPESGSMALNGRAVAEQIGGQIFIDAFGMVAPGDPELAARLARHAAGVSHDGESVHAAVVVASMVAAAFVESDMERLLDVGVAQIPADSLIARLHRDVRAWCRELKDWRKVMTRIQDHYGYRDHGGGCHILPNHALMVMAWSLAGADFFQAQRIVNTAGWDTDCNAGNVGAVMGVQLGLAGINARYDYQTPFADRILCPSAEGTSSTTDCLREALRVARIGRRVMCWPALPEPKTGAFFHFSLPGARHGFMAEEERFSQRGNIRIGHMATDGGGLLCRFQIGVERSGRFSTPLLARAGNPGSYDFQGSPLLYPGQTIRVRGTCRLATAPVRLRCFARGFRGAEKNWHGLYPSQEFIADRIQAGPNLELITGAAFVLDFRLPDNDGLPLVDLGLELSADAMVEGEILIDRIEVGGSPSFSVHPQPNLTNFPGWISSCDCVSGRYLDQTDRFGLVKNQGPGLAVTGNRLWKDYRWSASVCPHMAEAWGVVVRYQGLERYLAVLGDGRNLRLVRRWYGSQTELASVPFAWELDQPHEVAVECVGTCIRVAIEGRECLRAEEHELLEGGAGLITVTGHTRFSAVRVARPDERPN